MGPSESTGKYVSPTRIRTTENSNPANKGPCVGNVPAEGGDGCLRADPPAIASTGTMSTNRPTRIANANDSS